jgi:hypothetical protein
MAKIYRLLRGVRCIVQIGAEVLSHFGRIGEVGLRWRTQRQEGKS